LDEYLAFYYEQTAKIERFGRRIEELASDLDYNDNVKKLGCLLGIKTRTALPLIVETGDFSHFKKGRRYPSETSAD
jgi:transposase